MFCWEKKKTSEPKPDVTWYGGQSIRLNFLKCCLTLASMASKDSVWFSHFLFISLSKKGWKNTKDKFWQALNKVDKDFRASFFGQCKRFHDCQSFKLSSAVADSPGCVQTVFQQEPWPTGWWSGPGKSLLSELSLHCLVGHTACSDPPAIYRISTRDYAQEPFYHQMRAAEQRLYLSGGQQLTRAMVLET